MVLADSNIILDIWDSDPVWAQWSRNQLDSFALMHEMAINPVIYAEIASRYSTQAKLDEAIAKLGFSFLPLPREAAFLASRTFAQYRQLGGTRTAALPDFFIGAHAEALGCALLTRDVSRYRTYFPTVTLITP
jgi:predicted nucleic acid-binding protein